MPNIDLSFGQDRLRGRRETARALVAIRRSWENAMKPSRVSARPSRRLLPARAAAPILALAFALMQPAPAALAADPGVTATEVVIGTTQPLTGPVASYGLAYQTGMGAWFDFINSQGGVRGRKIKFIVYDDAYQVPKTVQFTRVLVESDDVFATVYQLGTEANSAINPYLSENGVPNFPATNTSKFNDPAKSPWTVVPTGPTNADAAQIMAKDVIARYPGATIGILFQNDLLGKEYAAGFKKAFPAGTKFAEESYETSDTVMDSQVIKLKASGATVWFLAAATKFAALAVVKADAIGWQPQIYAVQQATDAVTIKAMGSAASDRIVTYQTIKDTRLPRYQDDPAIVAYRKVLTQFRPDADMTNPRIYEGMAEAKLFTDMLATLNEPTRAGLLAAYRHIKDYDMGVYIPKFQAYPGNNMLGHAARLARWNGTNFEPFGDVISTD
jgi:ABC-type branched-subunit amino acid transport system substrate-binding protein